MKAILKILFSIILTISALSCKDDDTPQLTNAEQVPGKWKVTSGNLFQNADYIYFNKNETQVLYEDDLGFKDSFEVASANITETNITLKIQGEFNFEYTLKGATLTLTETVFGGSVVLQRNNDAPDFDTWIKTLKALSSYDTPWNNPVDIGFDNNYILGYSGSVSILQLNTTDAAIAGTFPTAKAAKAVAYQSDGSILMSDGNTGDIYVYNMLSSSTTFLTSISETVDGLAYAHPFVWISSRKSKKIHFYDWDFGIKNGEIALNITPAGLAYKDGFLYVSDGYQLHKCQTTPTFKAVESYRLPKQAIYGIAFDGTNFWLNTTDNKLVRVSLVN